MVLASRTIRDLYARSWYDIARNFHGGSHLITVGPEDLIILYRFKAAVTFCLLNDLFLEDFQLRG